MRYRFSDLVTRFDAILLWGWVHFEGAFKFWPLKKRIEEIIWLHDLEDMKPDLSWMTMQDEVEHYSPTAKNRRKCKKDCLFCNNQDVFDEHPTESLEYV